MLARRHAGEAPRAISLPAGHASVGRRQKTMATWLAAQSADQCARSPGTCSVTAARPDRAAGRARHVDLKLRPNPQAGHRAEAGILAWKPRDDWRRHRITWLEIETAGAAARTRAVDPLKRSASGGGPPQTRMVSEAPGHWLSGQRRSISRGLGHQKGLKPFSVTSY